MSQNPGAENKETLLFAIQDRVLNGDRHPLRPSEAALLLTWIVENEDEQERSELLHLFKALGGVALVQSALSDYG